MSSRTRRGPRQRQRHHELDQKVRANFNADRADLEPTFLAGHVVTGVTELKAASENLVIHGSGQLTETLRGAGLIDEYRLLIAPVVLGTGRKLFTGTGASTFTVTANSTAHSGMSLLTLASV